MAAAGVNFNQVATVEGDPDSVMQDLVAAASGAQGYSLATGGSGSLVLTRKYTPTWAVVLAIIGLLIFLLGLLFLLVRNTETLTVSLRAAGSGTEIRISGLATPEMQSRINAVIAARPAPATPPTTSLPSGLGSPAAQGRVEERLAELDRLQAQGLIEPAEYDEQRERLLREI